MRLAKVSLTFSAVVAAITMVLAISGCGASVSAAASASPSPSPAPAWLVRAARAQAASWGKPIPAAAYWGRLGDPELGRLTGGGPPDPSRKAYVVILVGDYSRATSILSILPKAGSSSSPTLPVKWICFEYGGAKHDVVSYGVYTNDFKSSRYPDLSPLSW